MIRSLLITLALFVCVPASAQTMVYDFGDGAAFGWTLDADGNFMFLPNVTIFRPGPPEPPQPTDDGQLICIRPWSCTLDESDADLTIRESIDAVQSDVPYFTLLPGVLDEDMQPHPAVKHYRETLSGYGARSEQGVGFPRRRHGRWATDYQRGVA